MLNRFTIIPVLVLLLLSGAARAGEATTVISQNLAFDRVEYGQFQVFHATVDLTDISAKAVLSVQLVLASDCPELLADFIPASSLFLTVEPTEIAEAIDPDASKVAFLFRSEASDFRAEISLAYSTVAYLPGNTRHLYLGIDCAELDCACTGIIETGELHFIMRTQP